MRFKFLALLLIFVAGACKSTVKNDVASMNEDGFQSLWNGRDLSGWIYGKAGAGFNKSGEGYRVRDGVLYCTANDGGNLFTEKEYSNFIFRFEFKLSENANNGLGIRAPLEGDAAYDGMEIQILDDWGSKYRNLQPWQYHGSIYHVFPAIRGALRPAGEWNEQEVVANGTKIKVVLNGKTIVDADLANVKDPETLQKHPGLFRKQGHIGFLGHGAHVEFRGMRIREL
ncbi:MAG: DUF1080 domain-containing protein [Planctomycetota bacterium]